MIDVWLLQQMCSYTLCLLGGMVKNAANIVQYCLRKCQRTWQTICRHFMRKHPFVNGVTLSENTPCYALTMLAGNIEGVQLECWPEEGFPTAFRTLVTIANDFACLVLYWFLSSAVAGLCNVDNTTDWLSFMVSLLLCTLQMSFPIGSCAWSTPIHPHANASPVRKSLLHLRLMRSYQMQNCI